MLDKGAQTRFNNDRQRAAQSSLATQVNPNPSPLNGMKQSGLPGNIMGGLSHRPNPNSFKQKDLESVIVGLSNPRSHLSLPTIFNQDLSQYKTPPEDGSSKWNLDSFISDIDLERFFETPKVSEAITRSKLTEYFRDSYGRT